MPATNSTPADGTRERRQAAIRRGLANGAFTSLADARQFVIDFAAPEDRDVLVATIDEMGDECAACESTGRIPSTAVDSSGEPYDTSAPCPNCSTR